jgi:hypothetical protein
MQPVLERVQALGDLHTARFTYENVFEHATEREAQDWTGSIPGVASLVSAATRNTALVGVNVEVEAGVDLSKAKLTRTALGGTLRLPLPTVYKPQVDAHVYETRRGILWRDDNIAIDAITDAKVRMTRQARHDGIVREAEKNAISTLSGLFPDIAGHRISVVFG